LEFLVDDAWINEGYEATTIDSSDMSAKVEEDEELVDTVCSKFGFSKDVLLKSLREGIYDDIAAIYHIYYFERLSKQDGNRTRSNSVTPDRRESITPGPAREAVSAPAQAPPLHPELTSPRTPIGTIPETAPVEQFQVPSQPTSGGPSDDAPGRRRTNTIVGIFRNPMRRLSVVEGSSAAAAQAAAAVQQDAPRGSTSTTASGEDGSKPRSLRFTFNSNSTSTKPPDDIVQEILNACATHRIEAKCIERYVISCSCNDNTPKAIKFEIEVCKLPRLKNLHGLKFKRIFGSSSDYKDACELVLNTVSL
jgi:MAP/microtubule affinity-regulating kinase